MALGRGRIAEVSQDEYAQSRGERRLAAKPVNVGTDLVHGLALEQGNLGERIPHLRLETDARAPSRNDNVSIDQ
jgi:hypothetical protein